MAGIDANTPIPSAITLHQKSRQLELIYPEGASFRLDFEFLRVFTPSAEARGHGSRPGSSANRKRLVSLERIEPVGTYALRLVFSDGHDSGLYSWDLLHNLATHQQELWLEYLKQLETAGLSRDEDTTARPPIGNSGCGHHH